MARLSDTETTGTDDAPAALPGDGLREGIVDDLRSRIGDALVEHHILPNTDLTVRVSTEAWAETAAALKTAGFAWFGFLSAIDWLPSPYGDGEDDPTVEKEPIDQTIVQGVCGGETRMQVFARLTDLSRHVGITVKADVPDDAPVVDSWTGSFAGANWHERECHEMFGIGFNGHPDLRNMYLPGDFEGFPLRKDFPLLARMVKPWPGIVDVEPMPEQAEEIADAPLPVTGDDGTIDAAATEEVTGEPPVDPDATMADAAATGDEATQVGASDDDTASTDDAGSADDDTSAGDEQSDGAADGDETATDAEHATDTENPSDPDASAESSPEAASSDAADVANEADSTDGANTSDDTPAAADTTDDTKEGGDAS